MVSLVRVGRAAVIYDLRTNSVVREFKGFKIFQFIITSSWGK